MTQISIPLFVKNMGHRIVSYILNLSEEDAENVLNNNIEISDERTQILQQFIDICKHFRMQGIDQPDVDFLVFHSLPGIFLEGQHIFNIWHEQMGGKVEIQSSDDPIVEIINKIVSKLYPLFLIKMIGTPNFFNKMHNHILSSIYSLPEYRLLCSALKKDPVFLSIFDKVGDNEINTTGSYMASSGNGGTMQLATFPSTLVVNSFELMRMRGEFSLESFANATEYTVSTIRQCIKGDVVNVPVFLGFNNISVDKVGEIKTEWGILRPITEGISELTPNNTSTTNIDGKTYNLGFVLESTYPYKVNFGEAIKKAKFPKELNEATVQLNKITENLSLSFSLACERVPAVGMSSAWTVKFNPLSHGTSISWNSVQNSPARFHILENGKELDELLKWSDLLKNVEDSKIRIALRRILSAINQRNDPIDGFIDTVIAWENLFGGNAELKFRISVSIAKLLGNNEAEKLELQKMVSEYYDTRSKLVHGVKEITPEQAIEYRDNALDIALKAIRKLYLERVELIQDANRAKVLALI